MRRLRLPLGVLAALVLRLSLWAQDVPVALPPFLVEEMAKGPPWRYGEAMGYEILSRCGDATTRRVVDAHHHLHSLLAEILPPHLQLKFSVPRALILYDEELQPAASKEVIAKMLRDTEPTVDPEPPAPGGFRGLRIATPVRRYTFLPNLRLWDRDSMTVFMIVRREDFDPDRLALTHDYISYLLKSRVPGLPPWFVSGFLTLYAQINYRGGELSLPPLQWISDAHTETLKKDPKVAPPVQPLADFLAGKFIPPETSSTFEPKQAWQAQAALFVRWGLDGGGREHREAFWKFAERAALEGSTEKLFRECFGFDFSGATTQLTAYLPSAVRRTVSFKPARRTKLPPVALRNASDGEIARLKGDWERLEISYVKLHHPQLAVKYLEQARRTLRRAYDRDDRDPRLLAIMGLCELDGDNRPGAREYLEAAANRGDIRARANYELARLRLVDFCARPEGPDGRISSTQLADVLRPLFAARAENPPLPEVYELIGEAWKASAGTPTRGHLAVLDEGIRLFPRRTALIITAAELNLQHGYRDSAGALAEIAHRLGDLSTRERLRYLQRELEGPEPAPR